MKKVFFAVLAICMVASMSFAAQKTVKAEGPEFVCNDEVFGPVYSLNKYVVGSKIIPLNTVNTDGTAAQEIPFVCEESWLCGYANALATGFEAENLAFPRHSIGIVGGPEAKQNTALCFKIKMPTGGAFFGMDIVFHQCATTVTDMVLPGTPYLPIYLIDDVFGYFTSGGETIIYLDISPDLGMIIRGSKNANLGPWDYFVVCDLDPNDYDNDGYYEAALGFRASPTGVSPIIEWGSKAIDGEIGCAIMTHILLNPPPGEGKLLGANFDVADPHPYWPVAGAKHSEALAGESEWTRPWCFKVFSDGV